jgi:hypothetical protein
MRSLLIAFLMLGYACPASCGDDAQVGAALTELSRAFRNHRFDPAIMAPFDRRMLDPLIVEMEWNEVRGHVEAALKPLYVGIRPISLPCQFRPLPAADDHKGEKPHHLIPVFIFEKGNDRTKAVLKRALGLRDDALWDYEPATGMRLVQDTMMQTVTVTVGDFRPQYLRGGAIYLLSVHQGLQELIRDKSIEQFHFRSERPAIVDSRLRFTTVWITCCKTKYVTYAWRLKVILERNPTHQEAWELTSKVEIAKRYASQADFTLVADSMKGDFLSEHVTVGMTSNVHKKGKRHVVMRPVPIPGEPLKDEVPPPIERVTAEETSILEDMVPLLADLCRNKLLKPAEITP